MAKPISPAEARRLADEQASPEVESAVERVNRFLVKSFTRKSFGERNSSSIAAHARVKSWPSGLRCSAAVRPGTPRYRNAEGPLMTSMTSSRSLLDGAWTFEFDGHPIRCGGTLDNPWFVAQDVGDALGIKQASDSISGFPADEKGSEVIHTPGGRQTVIVLYESGLYRMIFRSNKPEAERFRRWVFHEVLPAIRKTGGYRVRERERYRRLGKSEEWIEQREKGIEVRKGLTGTLQEHGVTEGKQFADCTNAVYRPILGGTAAQVKKERHLPVKANLRDNLSLRDSLMVSLSELLAQEKVEAEDRQGFSQCWQACDVAGRSIASAAKQVGQSKGQPARE